MEEQKASWATKINYGIGAMGKGLSYGLYGQIERYLRNILHLSDKFYMPLSFVEKIWDGINDMMMGVVVDNTYTKWGKFRPWCAIGALTNALMVIATFGTPAALLARPVWLCVYVTFFYFLWDMTYTMVDVAYWAMIPALSKTPGERDQFAMIPRLASGILGLAGAFIMPIVEWLGGGKGETNLANGYFKYALITSAIYVCTSLYSAATTKELDLGPPPPKEQRERFSLPRALKILWNNKQVLVIVGVMILFNMAQNLTNGGMNNYLYFARGSGTQQGIFGAAMGAAQGVGLFLFPILSKRLGRLKVYAGSLVLPCLGYAVMAIANLAAPDGFIPLVAAAFIPFIGYGSMSVMQSVMLADAVDYGEYETGIRNEGIIFSMLTLLSKFAGAFASIISTTTYVAVKFGGQYSNEATPLAIGGFRFLMFILPPVLLLCAFALYRGGYKLTPSRMEQVKAELEARKQVEAAAEEEAMAE